MRTLPCIAKRKGKKEEGSKGGRRVRKEKDKKWKGKWMDKKKK